MSSVTKPTGPLKALLETTKRQQRLLGKVEQHLLLKPPSFRSTDVMHPSGIVKGDWCARAAYYVLNGAEVKKQKPTLRLQNIFDEGHYIHDKWQRRFWDMGVLYGLFSCLNCGMQQWLLSPTSCYSCGAGKAQLTYREVPLESDPEYRIAGQSDGWIKGVGADCLIEVKSMSMGTVRMESPHIFKQSGGDLEKAWGMVRHPFGSHLRQGALYLELGAQMRARGELGFEDFPEEIVFIYELKSNQAIKEFVVRRDPSVITHILDQAAEVVRAFDKGVPPGCTMDLQSGCQQCREFEDET